MSARRAGLLGASFLSLAAVSSTAQELQHSFAGRWVNAAGPIVTALEIQTAGGHGSVRASGQCEREECDWGTSEAVVYRARPGARGGPALTAVFTRDGVEHHLILHAQGNERVGLEVLSRFEGDEARNSSVFSVLAKETPGGALRLTGTPAPVRVGGAIREPVKLKDVRPDYPQEARRERIQGLIVLECTIGPDGRVVEARPLQGEHQILIDAAIEAVKQWRYAPTLVNGVAVPIIMTVTVNFKLS